MGRENTVGQQSESAIAIAEINEILQGDFPTVEEYLKFRPPKNIFDKEPSGHHGTKHMARTVHNVLLLSKISTALGIPVDGYKAALAASLHDYERTEEYEDAGHGTRAAVKFLRQTNSFPPQEILDTIDIFRYIKYHDYPRDNIPYDVLSPGLFAVRDADALDRVRFERMPLIEPQYLLNEDRLYFPFSRILVPVARELEIRTRDGEESYEAVGTQAVEMGTLRPAA